MSVNKKEEQINLYLSAITTRDPSKRQIKPVDKDAFQLFDDFESGSDEDFVLNSEDESDENDDIKEDESNLDDEDEEAEADGGEECENVSERDSETNSRLTDTIVDIREKHLDNEDCKVPILTKYKLDSVMICMMCLLDVTYSDNEIIECDGCGVVVHEDCYKICDSVFMSCDNSDASTDPWFCDACLNNVQNPRCELCPVEGGVFKRTENNRWVHLQCALYTPGVAFNDVESLTEITLSELPLKEWSNRECCICSNPFYAKTGICISCDAGLCKNFFHVLCAQKEGLLSEPNVEENPDDPYFAQCQQHTDKEVAKRRRKNWAAAINRQKLRMENWRNGSHFSDARMLRKLEYFSSLYQKVREGAPSPFVPSTKVPCYLETNPVAVYLFKKKATNLRLSQEQLISYTNNSESKLSTGVPVFSPDFITYFVDREKKIDDLSVEIVRLESCHRDMQISEQNTSHQFNKAMTKKEAIIKEYKESREKLGKIFSIFENTTKSPEIVELMEQLISKFPIILNNNATNHHSDNSSNDTPSALHHSDNQGTNGHNNGFTTRDSVINECCKCKSVSDQHLMIDCDDCSKFFHLTCLMPPLTRMPRKTKLYGWQCASCARSSSDDARKQTIDINKPRQLRKLSDISSRYKRYENLTSSMNAKKRLLKNSRDIVNKKVRKSILKKPGAIVPKLDLLTKMKTETTNGDGQESVSRGNLSENGHRSRAAVSRTSQRRSHRSKKRPITLSGDFETPIFSKRSRHNKVIAMTESKKPAKSLLSLTKEGRHSKLKTKTSNKSSDKCPNPPLLDKNESEQLITFVPESELCDTSCASLVEEPVQIGVILKTNGSSGIYSSQKVEKKTLLIKCHCDGNDNNDNGSEILAKCDCGRLLEDT